MSAPAGEFIEQNSRLPRFAIGTAAVLLLGSGLLLPWRENEQA